MEMMLARTSRLYCDGLPNVTKQLLIWVFKEKRKFSTAKIQCCFTNERGEFYKEDHDSDRFNNRYNDRYSRKYNDRYSRRYNDSFNNRYGGGGRYNRDYNDRDYSNPRYRYESRSKFSINDFKQGSYIDWNAVELKEFKKDFYEPHPDVLNRSEQEIQEFHKKHDIGISGRNVPAPIMKFEELGLPEPVMRYLSTLDFSEPTPIQSVSWPIALSGRDLVGMSRTGSGKTLGFVLPAIVHILNQPPLEKLDGPIALVLAPTRELVQQIREVTDPIARANRMSTACLFGGASKLVQMNEISHKKHIYVATPGRLLDFLNSEVTNLKRCTYLVLDEADQMLNMGFEPQIRAIIDKIRPDRQVLMWSATWPKDIQQLANEFLKNYVKIQVGSQELSANPNIIQTIHVCEEQEKLFSLVNLLNEIKQDPDNKTLIFAETKFSVERIGRYLNSKGIQVQTLHGDHKQRQRDYVLNSFRVGRTNTVVATNVAGRGLDVDDIKYVINFDFPKTVEEYVHKIGRTARRNNSGTAHTFFTPSDVALAADLISLLESTNQIISPELKELADGAFRLRKKGSRS